MARSRPATVGKEAVASRAMVESSTLVIAKVAWPARLALRRGASVSAVSPDWDTTITAVSVKDRPIAVLAAVLHVDGNAAEVFDNQLGEQTCIAAGPLAATSSEDRGRFVRIHRVNEFPSK